MRKAGYVPPVPSCWDAVVLVQWLAWCIGGFGIGVALDVVGRPVPCEGAAPGEGTVVEAVDLGALRSGAGGGAPGVVLDCEWACLDWVVLIAG